MKTIKTAAVDANAINTSIPTYTAPIIEGEPGDFCPASAVNQRNRYVTKYLSCWAFNIVVGCLHACRFCFVPNTSTIKLGPKLAEHDVEDPHSEWGNCQTALRTSPGWSTAGTGKANGPR